MASKVTLQTASLRPYKRVMDVMRYSGNQLYESVYLDFENEKLLVQHPMGVVQLPLEVDREDPQDDWPENFYVDSDKFFYLVKTYEDLMIDGTEFSHGKDTFTLRYLKEDYDVPELPVEVNKIEENTNTLGVSVDEFYKHLKNCINHVDTDVSSPLNGVFLTKSHMVGTDKHTFYDVEMGYSINDTTFPFFFVRMLMSLPALSDDSIKIGEWGDSILLICNDMYAVFSKNTDLQIVDITDENFVSGYDHESYIDVDAKEWLQIIEFLEPFTKDIVKNRFKMRVEEEEGKFYLKFEVVDVNHVEKQIEISEPNNKEAFVDQDIWVDSSKLKLILNQLGKLATIRMQFDSEKPALNFKNVSLSNTHIMYARMKEE